MATLSSILAWGIPWTEESGGLQSMGSQRVRHNLANKQQQGRTGDRQQLKVILSECFMLTGGQYACPCV